MSIKHLNLIILIAFVAILAVLLIGCATPAVIEKIDPVTGKVYERITTSRDAVDKVMDSTRDKTCIFWDTGWIGGVRYTTTPTPENPTFFSLELLAGKQNKGLMTIKKEDLNTINKTAWDGIAKVIQATNAKSVSITKDGIGETENENGD